ncbi:LytTR family DNA-binding domain-containing protein [uncultured Nocardioides sp.]|uniref:LytR/AlgR family response regulator transcription factor n=1 Tax=uncultured Nocardioides sp. TaxID=198441 RepID=UPI00262F414A|nr:LytTR family DNA-binding domain-containing protein [uncultured Nocardioides sp.]
MSGGLRVLVVDDEQPSRDELAYLLGRDERVAAVDTVGSAAEALRRLHADPPDCLVLDVQMPGTTGLDLAAEVARLPSPPPVVFVTAHDQHAVAAFELSAVDYVLKPVRAERLAEAVRRVVRLGEGGAAGPGATPGATTVPVERGGATRFLDLAEVTHVEAHGDYVRLHTGDDAYLLRAALSSLEEEWAAAGFVRVHRSLLVSLSHVTALRSTGGRTSVVVSPAGSEAETELAVARRHARELRELLVGRATP